MIYQIVIRKKNDRKYLSGNSEEKSILKKLLAVGWGIFVESDHGEHLAGFFAGFGVDEEVLHEDLWGGGVRGAVLVVVVFFDVVLLCYCLEDSADLDGLAVGAGHTV